MTIKIGDTIWHPCSIDIIEHKIVSIRQFEGFNHYIAKAIHNVGACGRVEVILDEHKGKLRFVELLHEEEIEYSSGLQDFIEGNYYTNKEEARLEFYNQQQTIAWSNMEQKEKWYKEAKARYEQVKLIVDRIENELK